MKLAKSKLQQIIKEEFQILIKEDRQEHISGIKAKIPRLEAEVERIEDAMEAREAEIDRRNYPEKEYELRDLRTTPEYFEMTSRRDAMQEKIQELERELKELTGESLDEKKKWMQDIKSTGECTPYTKPECKGRARAFAKRAQKGDVHKDNLKKGKNPHGPG